MKYFLLLHGFHLPKKYRTKSYANKLRQIACAKFVNKQMPFAVSKLYVDRYYDRITHEKVVLLFETKNKKRIHSSP